MSLGALTTTFIPPSSCISSFSNAYVVIQSSTLYQAAGPVSTAGCFPSNYQDARTNYYSPGICPAGYTSACTSLNVLETDTETVVTCCPTFVLALRNITVSCINLTTDPILVILRLRFSGSLRWGAAQTFMEYPQ